MPPDGELEDDEVGALEPGNLALDFRTQRPGLESVALFGQRHEHLAVDRFEVIFPLLDRIEALAVEIGDLNRVAPRPEHLGTNLDQTRVERAGFGMAVDEQDMHRAFRSRLRPSCGRRT